MVRLQACTLCVCMLALTNGCWILDVMASEPGMDCRAKIDSCDDNATQDDKSVNAAKFLLSHSIGAEKIAEKSDTGETKHYWEVKSFAPYETPSSEADLETHRLRSTAVFKQSLQHLRTLRPIKLLNCPMHIPFSAKELEALCEVVTDSGIESLSCRGVGVTDEIAAVLKAVPVLSDLELASPRLTKVSIRAVAKMQNLETLSICEASADVESFQSLYNLHNLRVLLLEKTNVTNPGLNGIDRLKKLEYLSVANTEIGDEGMQYVQNMPHLAVINLANSQVTDSCMKMLSTLKGVRHVCIEGTAITSSAVDAFILRNPGCVVVR